MSEEARVQKESFFITVGSSDEERLFVENQRQRWGISCRQQRRKLLERVSNNCAGGGHSCGSVRGLVRCSPSWEGARGWGHIQSCAHYRISGSEGLGDQRETAARSLVPPNPPRPVGHPSKEGDASGGFGENLREGGVIPNTGKPTNSPPPRLPQCWGRGWQRMTWDSVRKRSTAPTHFPPALGGRFVACGEAGERGLRQHLPGIFRRSGNVLCNPPCSPSCILGGG